MAKKKFPTIAVIVLVLAVLWLLGDLGFLGGVDIPWLPVILIIASLGWIFNRFHRE